MSSFEAHLSARPPEAVTLRLNRYRKSTAKSIANGILGGVVDAVIGAEGDTGHDDRPPGLDLSWHDAAGHERHKTRLHPYKMDGYPPLLRRLTALPLEGVRVEHAVGGQLYDTWTPGAPLFCAQLPPPGPPRAALEALGWTVDFDGRALVARREWAVSSSKVAKVARFVRRKSDAPAVRELRAGPDGLTLLADPGDAPEETHLPRADLRCLLKAPAAWGERGDTSVRVIGPEVYEVLAFTEPGSTVSTTKSRKAADGARDALHALLLIALARAA